MLVYFLFFKYCSIVFLLFCLMFYIFKFYLDDIVRCILCMLNLNVSFIINYKVKWIGFGFLFVYILNINCDKEKNKVGKYFS